MDNVIKKAMERVSLNGGTLYVTSDSQIFESQSFAHSHSFNLKDKTKYIVSDKPVSEFERVVFEGSQWVYVKANDKKEDVDFEEMTVKELKAYAEDNGLGISKTKKKDINNEIKAQL